MFEVPEREMQRKHSRRTFAASKKEKPLVIKKQKSKPKAKRAPIPPSEEPIDSDLPFVRVYKDYPKVYNISSHMGEDTPLKDVYRSMPKAYRNAYKSIPKLPKPQKYPIDRA